MLWDQETEMDRETAPDFKQVIVLRKDLNMRKGKMVAQGAHASMGALLSISDRREDGSVLIPADPRVSAWLGGQFKKVCVSVDSEAELLEIEERAKAAGMICCLIRDSGLTEFGGVPTHTGVCIGPDAAEKIDAITGHLKLL
jgi:PTH2 family peptidyl-tRNA hydrolase